MSNNVFKFRLVLIILIVIFSCPTAILNAQRSGGLQENLEAVADLERNYEKRLLWGERFFNLRFNSLALKQFEEAVKIKPSAYFPQYRISQIKLLLRQTNNSIFGELIFDFNKPGFLISMILFVILFSLTSMTLALVTVLFNRNKMVKREKKVQYLKEEYQTMLVNYLFAKEVSQEFVQRIKKVASNNFNRKVLIDQMIDLSITLTGEEKERLKDLYMILRLDQDSYKKAMGRKWHIKAKGFRELAFMNISTANDEIRRCLSSRNDVLRMEAQFAMIRLNTENSFEFLNHLDKNYTLWEQLNVYETITFHHLNLPDFERLLLSENSSIVMFSLRMIKIFKLNKAYNSLIQLLTHKDPEVRNLTIQVIGFLKMNEALPHLKKIYKNETYDNCLAIIQAFASINDENMLNFLKLVLDKEDDVQLQIEAAIAINKAGVKGSETLNKLLQSDYKNYQIIVKHVLDKRIN
jgi:hypothetical protein